MGHSTRSSGEFLALLQEARIEAVADVRRFPGSRRYPQFNAAALAETLAAAGILYRPMPGLGGRRGKRPDGAPSPHTLWREEAFRNFADYAETDEFRAAFEALLTLARERRAVVMCAEAVWWRCHRRIIADYLIAAGFTVEHILAPGKIEPAQLTPGAAIGAGGRVLYRAPALL